MISVYFVHCIEEIQLSTEIIREKLEASTTMLSFLKQ